MKNIWKRENFISIVGFYGNVSLVDKKIRKKIQKCSVSDLLKKGMYRESVCAALFDGDRTEKKVVCQYFFGDIDDSEVENKFIMLLLEFGVYGEVLDLPPKIKYIN